MKAEKAKVHKSSESKKSKLDSASSYGEISEIKFTNLQKVTKNLKAPGEESSRNIQNFNINYNSNLSPITTQLLLNENEYKIDCKNILNKFLSLISEIKLKMKCGKDLIISNDEILSERLKQLKNTIVFCSEKYKINLKETLTHKIGEKIDNCLFIKYLIIIISQKYFINVINDEIFKKGIINLRSMKGWDFEKILEENLCSNLQNSNLIKNFLLTSLYTPLLIASDDIKLITEIKEVYLLDDNNLFNNQKNYKKFKKILLSKAAVTSYMICIQEKM